MGEEDETKGNADTDIDIDPALGSLICSEETLSADPTWIVDPIDGTTNFVHCFPFTVISIALAVNYQPVLGVIFAPIIGEMYVAIAGEGASLLYYPTGAMSPVSSQPLSLVGYENIPLQQSLVITEFGPTSGGTSLSRQQRHIDQLVREHGVHGIRMLGSAAYNLCQVAAGRAQVYFEKGIHAWDIAAGALIVHEARGFAANWLESQTAEGETNTKDGNYNFQTFNLTKRSIIACSNLNSLQILQGICVE
jgi:fructose-1,6-bisphosphatase/inositol monophosphatase family enzyme